MRTRRLGFPVLLIAVLCALASIGVGTAKADGCGERYYRSRSYYRYSDGGCYVPRPVPYYPVVYPRAYYAPAPCYQPAPYYGGGGVGFSFSYGRGYGGGYGGGGGYHGGRDRSYYRGGCGR